MRLVIKVENDCMTGWAASSGNAALIATFLLLSYMYNSRKRQSRQYTGGLKITK